MRKQAPTPRGYKRWEDVPSGLRLQLGTLEEREAEAIRQGVVEEWETKTRRDRMKGSGAVW